MIITLQNPANETSHWHINDAAKIRPNT